VETFVIQIWAPDNGSGPSGDELRGFAEHVASGQRTAFRGATELIAFLEAQQDGQPQESER
jgi:hypothetical protein